MEALLNLFESVYCFDLSVVLFSQNAHLFFLDYSLYTDLCGHYFGFMRSLLSALNNETMEANSVLSSSIIEDINGIETIKSLTSEREPLSKD